MPSSYTNRVVALSDGTDFMHKDEGLTPRTALLVEFPSGSTFIVQEQAPLEALSFLLRPIISFIDRSPRLFLLESTFVASNLRVGADSLNTTVS